MVSSILEPMGFETDPDVIGAIGYRGTVANRLLRVSAAPRGRNVFTGYDNTSFRVYTGVMLTVATETSIATRLTASTSPLNWLSTRLILPRLGLKPVTAPEGRMPGIDAWAIEDEWARRFMATGAFRQVAVEGTDLSVTALVFTPEGLSLTCSPRTDQLDAATMDRWLHLTADLAEAAEADPPHHRAQRTWLERQSRGTRIALIVGALFGVPILLLGCFGVVIGAVIVAATLLL